MKWLSNAAPKRMAADYDVCSKVNRKAKILNGKKIAYSTIRIRFASNAYGAFKNSRYVGFSVPIDGKVYFSHGPEKNEVECLKLNNSRNSVYALIQDVAMASILSIIGSKCYDMKYDYDKKLYYIELEEGVEL